METFIDTRDNNSYKVVKIGNLYWFAENLKYADIEHYSANNDSKNDDKYGCLYTWENAMKACPPGWRLPTKEEFEQLIIANNAYSDPSVLRDLSWSNGSNTSGFSALPAGIYCSDYYDYFGRLGIWWSSTKINSSYVYSLDMLSYNAEVGTSLVNCSSFSVRCVKDD